MTPKNDVLDESASIIEEIETNLERVLQKRRGDIERELQEKIRREKEESERKLSLISREIEKERESLKDYRETITEYESQKDALLADVRAHLDLALDHQREIEKLTAATREELRKVDELSAGLVDLRQRSEDKIFEIRSMLKEKYGVSAESHDGPAVSAAPSPAPAVVPSVPSRPVASAVSTVPEALVPSPHAGAARAATGYRDETSIGADLEHELTKLKKIKELLEKDMISEGDFEPIAASAAAAEPAAGPEEFDLAPPITLGPEVPEPDFKMPEINQFIQDFVRRETEASVPEPLPEPRAAKKIAGEEFNFQTVFEMLEKYRKSEATDYNGEISYFQSKDRKIIDGESLIRAIGHVQETARKLIQKLAQTESPKDQFFLKQELINNQEILRKVLLRALRMCDKDGAAFPRYSADALNVAVLKEIVEKLNMDNWSTQDDFGAFEDYAGRLKDLFYKRITPPAHYLRSIVEELEG